MPTTRASRVLHPHAPLSRGRRYVGHLRPYGSSATEIPVQRGKKEGDISSVFPSLSGAPSQALPQRFADLKKEILGNNQDTHRKLWRSWVDLLHSLQEGVEELRARGNSVVPEISFEELVDESIANPSWVSDVKKRGTILVRDVVEDRQALAWKAQVRDYVRANPQVKGFPVDNKQVFELYWSKAQLQARSHPNVLSTQKALMTKLFHADPSAEVSLRIPISYADRLRIRLPGDSKFALGPHIDGGSLERWEDIPYRNCYREILQGRWRDHDAWDVGRRLTVNSDIYQGPSQCSVFRAFQAWLSLSHTGPNEGTIQVFPLLKEASAYVLLRPFFRPTLQASDPSFLRAESWRLDVETTDFPNSAMGAGQELNDLTHPHLNLSQGGMVSMKKVNPGDMVFWHCDGIHAVESHHRGLGDSSVFYIPVAPLSIRNATYLAQQQQHLRTGVPPPDFPGGSGEQGFAGVGVQADVADGDGQRASGFAPFIVTPDMRAGELNLIEKANRILGF